MTISKWLGSTEPLANWSNADRAYDTARHIVEQSSSITIVSRLSGSLPGAQTVRLEPLGGVPIEARSGNAVAANADVLIVGYKSHPSIADTDIQRGDRFLYDDQMYTVTQVLPNVPDRLLAYAEASE